MLSFFVRSGVGVKHVLDKTELWWARAPEKKLKKKNCFIAPLKKICVVRVSRIIEEFHESQIWRHLDITQGLFMCLFMMRLDWLNVEKHWDTEDTKIALIIF